MQCVEVRHEPAPFELPEPVQATMDAFGELARCFPGERQAEDLLPPHLPARDEPHDTPRHRLGLAAARPRDDERRHERRGDDARLLVRRRELSESGCEGGGARRHDRGHEADTGPIVWMRHSPYEKSSRQCSSKGAVNDVPRMMSTALRTRPRNAARASSSIGGCVGSA